MIELKNITVSYGELKVLDDLSFAASPGQWLMIVGPNGAGKSTIVNAISGGAPYKGEILLNGRNVRKYRSTEFAKKVGILAQAHNVNYSFTVEEVVRLGRYAYSAGFFSPEDSDEKRKVDEALQKTGMSSFRDKSVLTLSGGELQRTFLAQVFAQDPDILVLDEPTNHLDLIYQRQMFSLIIDWLKSPGKTVISVVHDLTLARAYGTHALLLCQGRKKGYGLINEVLTRENLREVYDMDVYEWMHTMLSQWEDDYGF